MIEIHYPTGWRRYFEVAQFITFSGGEEHINLKPVEDISKNPDHAIVLKVQLMSSKEVMQLFILTDALRHLYPNRISLFMSYLPYARQDRVCASGDAFSLDVFASLLNVQNYFSVAAFDPHSPVAYARIFRFCPIPQYDMCNKVPLKELCYIVSPDKGSKDKASQWIQKAAHAAQASLCTGSKIRDPHTGAITGTEVDIDDFKGGSCLIVDDICDGGRTFIELAKVLKDRGAGPVYLYVSHGIFSKGVEPLLESGIEQIYTTDSVPQTPHPNVTIVHRFFGDKV